MNLLFYIIFSLSISQNTNDTIDLDQFNAFSIAFFQNKVFSDSSETSPDQVFPIQQVSKYVLELETDDYNVILANHLLFRYFLQAEEFELAYQHGIYSLEFSDNYSNNDHIREIQFIRGYYMYYSKLFDSWMSIKHLFRGIRTNVKTGMDLIFMKLDINSTLHQLNLVDQYQIQFSDLYDYYSSIHTLNSLLAVATNKKNIFKKIADLNYQVGEFEQAISIYQQIASDQSLADQTELTYKIVSSYFYVAEFDISKQYIKRYLKPQELTASASILAHILKMEMKQKGINTDSLIQMCIINYNLSINVDEYKQLINFPIDPLNETDLYLNRKNLIVAESKIEALESNSDSLYTIKQFSLAKLFWAKKDFFNSKRYLHNLLNKYQNYFNKYMTVQANYILANIAFQSNDFDQSKRYLESADPQYLYFYQHPKFEYLTRQFNLKE